MQAYREVLGHGIGFTLFMYVWDDARDQGLGLHMKDIQIKT